jgi:catechol 2,3-dioxygenase-like lactoylglutathione lyase family enzyme
MIDHISIGVSNLERATRFYESVLGTIGYARLDVRAKTVGFGKRYSEFWLNHRPAMPVVEAGSGSHVCLRAPSRQAVDAFHAAAVAAGGESEGEPGERSQHGEGYYAAFVRDLDGNRIEAVTFLKRADQVAEA